MLFDFDATAPGQLSAAAGEKVSLQVRVPHPTRVCLRG
jgi:hypothetical protein